VLVKQETERVILPNVDFDTVQDMHATNDLFPVIARMAMGATPHVGGGRIIGSGLNR